MVAQVLQILLKSKLLATPGGEELEENQILPDTVINLFKGYGTWFLKGLSHES